ncbi:MAG: methyltransferase domain-containing protein [Vicinamibacterales bacterium]
MLRRIGRGLERRARVRITVAARALGLRPHVSSEARTYWEERGPRYLGEVSGILDPGDPYFAAQQDFLALLKDEAWGSILEVGCGFGWHLRAVAHTFPGRQAVGIDFSRAQLAQGAAFLSATNARLIQADAGSLPFSDATFDVVFTSGVLMCVHADQLPPLLGELRRVARQCVIAMEPAEEHMCTPAQRAIARRAGWHCHSYSRAFAAAGLALDAGFVFRSFESSHDRTSLSCFRGRKG